MNVREASFEVMRRHGMTTIFGNPGSTEITFLTDLPDDFHFVLALHEGSVVGIATGVALDTGQPAFVNLHTAPGLGNAVNAIANARDSRAPLVIVVGQQDRRQIGFEPFLTGRALERVAGEYPVWSILPPRAQDVPGAIARACHESISGRGPALVVVPMGDWLQDADPLAVGSPAADCAGNRRRGGVGAGVAGRVGRVGRVGAGADSEDGWAGVVALAERLGCPVWQEAFGSRAGFPQDHLLFAGHLPWMRAKMALALAGFDLVMAIGTGAFRAYLFDDPVPVVAESATVAVITDDPSEAHRSPCELAIVAPVGPVCVALADLVPVSGAAAGGSGREPLHQRPPRAGSGGSGREPLHRRPPRPEPPGPGEPLSPGHVLEALAQRLPAEAIVIEETPSSRPELLERIPARAPLGFVSNANGGLGFGFAGAIGLRMGRPDRPVVGVIGDGSAMYAIQALWSAARYEVGALLVVMSNGGYAIMDALARERGGAGPWPGFEGISIAGIASSLGCPSVRVRTLEELVAALDDAVPGLAERRSPLVLEVAVSAG